MSLPAARAITAAWGSDQRAPMPPIDRESDITTPSNASCVRRRETTDDENNAGTERAPRAGAYIAVTITESAPASIPDRKPGNWTAAHVASDSLSVGVA